MEPIKISLCPLCGECPEVEITDQDVRIGRTRTRFGCRMLNGMNSSG